MSILDKAKAIVDTDRQSQYGDPVENAKLQAQVASIIIGRPISALDCNAVNLAQKIVRMGRNDKEDTRVDVAGYTEIRDRLFKDNVKLLECIFCERPAIDKFLIYCSEHDLESRRITSDGELGA